jgi:nucleoside phosphorylase
MNEKIISNVLSYWKRYSGSEEEYEEYEEIHSLKTTPSRNKDIPIYRQSKINTKEKYMCTYEMGLITSFPSLIEDLKLVATKSFDQLVFSGRIFFRFVIGTKLIVAVVSGSGSLNVALTTQLLIDKFSPMYLSYIGLCGSLESNFHLGDIILPKNICSYSQLKVVSDKNKLNNFPQSGVIYNENSHQENSEENSEENNEDNNKDNIEEKRIYLKINVNEAKIYIAPMYTEIVRDPLDAFTYENEKFIYGLDDEMFENMALSLYDFKLPLTYDRKIFSLLMIEPYRCNFHLCDVCLSGDIFVDDLDFGEILQSKLNGSVVDRETFSFSHVAESNKIPYFSILNVAYIPGNTNNRLIDANLKIAGRNLLSILSQILNNLQDVSCPQLDDPLPVFPSHVFEENISNRIVEEKALNKVNEEKVSNKINEEKSLNKINEEKSLNKINEEKTSNKVNEEKVSNKINEEKVSNKINEEKSLNKVNEEKTSNKVNEERIPKKNEERIPKKNEERIPKKNEERIPKKNEEKTSNKVNEERIPKKNEEKMFIDIPNKKIDDRTLKYISEKIIKTVDTRSSDEDIEAKSSKYKLKNGTHKSIKEIDSARNINMKPYKIKETTPLSEETEETENPEETEETEETENPEESNDSDNSSNNNDIEKIINAIQNMSRKENTKNKQRPVQYINSKTFAQLFQKSQK